MRTNKRIGFRRLLLFIWGALTPLVVSAERHATTIVLPVSRHRVTIECEPSSTTGDFRKLQFRLDGAVHVVQAHQDLTFLPRGLKEREEIFWPVPGLQRDPSGCFMKGLVSSNGRQHDFLFLFGRPSGSDPGSVLVLGFNEVGAPYRALEEDSLSVVSFRISSDGKLELVARPSFSQVLHGDGRQPPYALTYDPFWVYQSSGQEPFQLSQAKSQAYNKEHYVWAGMKTREDVSVVFRKGRRPSLLSTKNLAKLLGTAKE